MKNNNSNNSSNVILVVSYKSYVYLNSKFSINYSLSFLENKVKKSLVLYNLIY